MKSSKKFIVLSLIFLLISNVGFCQSDENNKKYEGEDSQGLSLLVQGNDSISIFKQMIFESKHNINKMQFAKDTLIPNQETAVTISEAILFKIYGKEKIIRQKPYQVRKIDGYWVLNGKLTDENEERFLIIINAKNSGVLKCTMIK